MEANRKGAYRPPADYVRGGSKGWVLNKREHNRAEANFTQRGLPLPPTDLEMTRYKPPVSSNPRVADSQVIAENMYRPEFYEAPYLDARIRGDQLEGGMGFAYGEQPPAPGAMRAFTPQAEMENTAIDMVASTGNFDRLALPGPLTGAPDPQMAEGWRFGPPGIMHPGTGTRVGVPFQADTGGSEALLAFGAPVNFQPPMPPVSAMEVPAPSEMAAGGGTPGNSRA